MDVAAKFDAYTESCWVPAILGVDADLSVPGSSAQCTAELLRLAPRAAVPTIAAATATTKTITKHTLKLIRHSHG